MASIILAKNPLRRIIVTSIVKKSQSSSSNNVLVARNVLTGPTGVILPEPKKNPYSLLKVVLVLSPGIYIGAAIAKTGANILEENEIFVPTDDDDED